MPVLSASAGVAVSKPIAIAPSSAGNQCLFTSPPSSCVGPRTRVASISIHHGYSRRVPTFRFFTADVFTDVPLAGNQVAVFTDARGIPEERLQPLARELNFSETVFVYPAAGGGHP